MKLEIELQPEQMGILLDALVDYADRVQIEADATALDTRTNPALVFLARGVRATYAQLLEQLAPYADAIPAAQAYLERSGRTAGGALIPSGAGR